ncbi:lipase maturation [Pycnococcus provasolii]
MVADTNTNVVAAYVYLHALGIVSLMQTADTLAQTQIIHAVVQSKTHIKKITTYACLACFFSASLAVGVVTPVALFGLFICYTNTCRIGTRMLSYQWDALNVEAALWAIPMAPFALWHFVDDAPSIINNISSRTNEEMCSVGPPQAATLITTLLCVRLHVAGGAFCKATSGCTLWRSARALEHHLFTQPLPHVGAFVVRATHSDAALRLLTYTAEFAELVAPAALLMPWESARVAGVVTIALIQSAFALSGNFGAINLLAAVTALPSLPDSVFPHAFRRYICSRAEHAWWVPSYAAWAFLAVYVALALYPTAKALHFERMRTTLLSIPGWNRIIAFTALGRYVNHYGLFGRMTPRPRRELVFEQSLDGRVWCEMRARYRPGDSSCLSRAPAFLAFRCPRVDWSLWFLTNDNRSAHRRPAPSWFYAVLEAACLPGHFPGSAIFQASAEHTADVAEGTARARAAVYTLRPSPRRSPSWWTRDRDTRLYAGGAIAERNLDNDPEAAAARKIQAFLRRRKIQQNVTSASTVSRPPEERSGTVVVAGVSLQHAEGLETFANACKTIATKAYFEADSVRLPEASSAEDKQQSVAKLLMPLLGKNAAGICGISFSRCEIDDTGAAALAVVATRRPALNSLELTYSNVGARGILQLAHGCRQCKNLTHLSVDGSMAGNGGALAVASALKLGKCALRAVSLRDTLLGTAGIEAIADVACQHLERLDVGLNDAIGDEGAHVLARAVQASASQRRLRWLGMERCGVTNRGVRYFKDALSPRRDADQDRESSAATLSPRFLWFALAENYVSLSSLGDLARQTNGAAVVATMSGADYVRTSSIDALNALGAALQKAGSMDDALTTKDYSVDVSEIPGGESLLSAAAAAGVQSFVARACDARSLNSPPSQASSCLAHLDLTANLLDNRAIEQLSTALTTTMTNVTVLKLRANYLLDTSCIASLARAVADRSFQCVDLGETNASDEGAEAWAAVRVVELNLENASVGEKGAASLAEAVESGRVVRLRLAGNSKELRGVSWRRRFEACCELAMEEEGGSQAQVEDVEVTL